MNLSRSFPPPRFLQMPSVGFDISDQSIKILEFVRKKGVVTLGRYGERAVPEGIISAGGINDMQALSKIVALVRKDFNLDFIRASLPEEKAFLFKTKVPNLTEKEIRQNLEFQLEENVPIPPSQAVFDYDVAGKAVGEFVDVVVSAFPEPIIQSYLDLFKGAGLRVLSFEIEAQAIARALVSPDDQDTYMLVDFGRKRTGLAIMHNAVVRFTSTLEVGGDMIDAALQNTLGVSLAEAEKLKNEQGLLGNYSKEVSAAMLPTISSLCKEMERHALYWHTHESGDAENNNLKKIILCGGNANVAGLPEHISMHMKLPVVRGNVWQNAFSLARYIPELPFHASLGFATAIGLALRSND
jgi:type IV pilus assembly protein PilM